jgi:hypothetical protein
MTFLSLSLVDVLVQQLQGRLSSCCFALRCCEGSIAAYAALVSKLHSQRCHHDESCWQPEEYILLRLLRLLSALWSRL